MTAEAVQAVLGVAGALWLVVAARDRAGEPATFLLLAYWALSLPVVGQRIGILARQYPSHRNTTLRFLEPLSSPQDAEPTVAAEPTTAKLSAHDGCHDGKDGEPRIVANGTFEPAPFDHGAYRHAFENRRVDRGLAFCSADAEWRELRHADPPRAPNGMRGREEIGGLLHGVAPAPLTIQLSNELVSDARAAFTVTVTMEDGRRIVESVIVELRNGLIVKQLDVEAWDPSVGAPAQNSVGPWPLSGSTRPTWDGEYGCS